MNFCYILSVWHGECAASRHANNIHLTWNTLFHVLWIFLLVPGLSFRATNLSGWSVWNFLERTSCKVTLYQKCCSITFLFSFHLLLPDKLQCSPGTEFCQMRKDIKLDNKTKKHRWDPALCGKMTICSASPLLGNALSRILELIHLHVLQTRVC